MFNFGFQGNIKWKLATLFLLLKSANNNTFAPKMATEMYVETPEVTERDKSWK